MSRRRALRRPLIASAIVIAVVGAGAAVHSLRSGYEGYAGVRRPYGWGVIERFPGTRRGPTAAENRPSGRRSLSTCSHRAIQREKSAEDSELPGLSNIEAAIMLDPQARPDYASLYYERAMAVTVIAMRNHSHDVAIQNCFRQLRARGELRIEINRWTDKERAGAALRLADALDSRYDDEKFEVSYGGDDGYLIEVYRSASGRDIDAIRKEAESIGVAFQLRRLRSDAPKAVLQ
ncbi:MAG: hypothetical protein PGN13_05405 [Patulibacter minatonensis]